MGSEPPSEVEEVDQVLVSEAHSISAAIDFNDNYSDWKCEVSAH